MPMAKATGMPISIRIVNAMRTISMGVRYSGSEDIEGLTFRVLTAPFRADLEHGRY